MSVLRQFVSAGGIFLREVFGDLLIPERSECVYMGDNFTKTL